MAATCFSGRQHRPRHGGGKKKSELTISPTPPANETLIARAAPIADPSDPDSGPVVIPASVSPPATTPATVKPEPPVEIPANGNARPIQRTKTSLDLKSLQSQRQVMAVSNQPETAGNTSAPEPARESSPESILKAWRDFAESRKEQVAEYMLLQRPVAISGNIIRMTLGNAVEEPLLDGIRSDLLGWIREALDNPGISLEVNLQVEAMVRAAYTNREKLEEMKGKYPIVGELVERLGLDPDF